LVNRVGVDIETHQASGSGAEQIASELDYARVLKHPRNQPRALRDQRLDNILNQARLADGQKFLHGDRNRGLEPIGLGRTLQEYYPILNPTEAVEEGELLEAQLARLEHEFCSHGWFATLLLFEGLRESGDDVAITLYKSCEILPSIHREMPMAKFSIVIPDDLHKEFRIRVIELYGTEKGAITKAVTDALRLWLKQREPPSKKK